MLITHKTRSRAKFEEKWDLNFRSPVSRLPPEVLLLIFGFVRLGQEEQEQEATESTQERKLLYSADEPTGNIGWVAVGQVSRRWREAALGSPKLWSHIKVEDKKCRWAMEMLRRSKQTSLNIHLDLYIMDKRCRRKQTRTALARTALAHVQRNLARCKSLSISLDDCGYTLLESVLGGHLTPNLETLIITGQRVTQHDIELSDKELTANSLRVLKLSYVTLDLNSMFLRGLKTLQLHYCTSPTPFLRLLDSLAMMPLLRQLDVYASGFALDESELPLVKNHSLSSRPLDLVALTTISSRTPFETTALLSVVAKQSMHLDISVLGIIPDASEDVESFWRAVSDHLSEARRSFGMYGFGMSDAVFVAQGLRGIKTTTYGTQEDPATFKLQLSFSDDKPLSLLLHSAYHHLPMSSLSGINIYSNVSIDLPPTMATTQTVKLAYLGGTFVPGFFEILCEEDTFPALKHVIVTVQKSFFLQFESKSILRGLQSRHQRGAPIKILSLRGFSIMPARTKKALQTVVGLLDVRYEE